MRGLEGNLPARAAHSRRVQYCGRATFAGGSGYTFVAVCVLGAL
jgi:hypothetical protein